MKLLKLSGITFIAFLCFSACTSTFAAEEGVDVVALKAAFAKLKRNSDYDLINSSLDKIRNGGMMSVKVLVNHLNDDAEASDYFVDGRHYNNKGDAVERSKWRYPKMGEVAFDLVQEIVEGRAPLEYRRYFVLTPENAKRWVDKHDQKSLLEVQIEATIQSLKSVESDRDGSEQKLLDEISKFFEKRLVDLRAKMESKD
jgi:hypothetical protein